MKPNLAICIPTQSLHPFKFTTALATQLYTLGLEGYSKLMLIPATSSIGAFRARNHILRILTMLEKEHGWKVDLTMWFDSDMLFPSRTLQALESHGKDIVGATYRRRSPPYELLGKPKGGSQGTYALGTLAPAERLPSGCMLVRREIFEKMEEPVFSMEIGNGVDVTGEDSVFCDKAAALGYEIWLDTTLTSMCRHIDQDHELVPEIEDAPTSPIIMPKQEMVLQ